LRRAFVVYVVSSNRPFVELLEPARLDISQEFARGFEGMTDAPVKIEELTEAREQLVSEVVGKMPPDHKKFLLSLKEGEPQWTLIGLPVAEMLPAVLWRLQNLTKMDPMKRSALIERLRRTLQI